MLKALEIGGLYSARLMAGRVAKLYYWTREFCEELAALPKNGRILSRIALILSENQNVCAYDSSRSWQVEKLWTLLSESSRIAAGKAENTRLFRIVRVLEESPAVSFVLDSKHRFVYTNPAWDSFAQLNNAPQIAGETIIGFNIFDAIPEVLKPVYADAFRRVAETGTVWGMTNSCSSPERARRFRMKIYCMERRN